MTHPRPLVLAIALTVALGPLLIQTVPAATLGPVTDPIGVLRVKNGEPIVIAYWQATSGPNASHGIDQVRGIQLAIADKGNVAGFPVRLVAEDSACLAEGGAMAATRIAANRQVVAAIGSTCSSEAVRGAPILWRAGIVTVSGSTTAPELTDAMRPAGLRGYLRTAHNDKMHGRVAALFAYSTLGVRRAAAIHDGSSYSKGMANTFRATFRRLGGRVTSETAIAPGDTDMRGVLTRIASGRPDLIYYPVFIAEGGYITQQAKKVAGLERVILMGADGMFSPDFLRAAGDAATGTYLSSPDLSVETLGPGYKSLLDKYLKQFHEKPPSAYHAHAYDAAMLVLLAIERVGKKDSAGDFFVGRKALRDALLATKNYHGVTGTLTCDTNGDCADPKIAIYQVVSADPKQWNPGTNPKIVKK